MNQLELAVKELKVAKEELDKDAAELQAKEAAAEAAKQKKERARKYLLDLARGRVPQAAAGAAEWTQDEVQDLQTLGAAGLPGGIHAGNTYRAYMRPGALESHEGLSDSRVIYKVTGDETYIELVTYLLSKELDWDIVPEVRVCDLGKGIGHAMRWADDSGHGGAAQMQRDHGKLNTTGAVREFAMLKVLDCLTGNTDRHGGNYIVDPQLDKVWAIDNGYDFKHGAWGGWEPAVDNEVHRDHLPAYRAAFKRAAAEAVSKQHALLAIAEAGFKGESQERGDRYLDYLRQNLISLEKLVK